MLASNDEDSAPTKNRLLAIHRDGELRCFSQDLKIEEWKTKIPSRSGGVRVEFAVLISVEEAQQSLLKNREDILAILGDVTEPQNIHIMILVTRSFQMASKDVDAAPTLRIIKVETSKETRTPLMELMSFPLPQKEDFNAEALEYSWHEATGSILQHASKTLSIYDLNESPPQLTHHLNFGVDKFTSCLRLSSSTVALTREESIFVIDMRYHSLQARYPFEILSKHPSKTEKHRPQKFTKNGLCLTSYFPHLNLITALHGRELAAIQDSNLKKYESGPRKRKRESLLINSVGRAFSAIDGKHHESLPSSGLPKALGKLLPSFQSIGSWKKQKKALNNLFSKQDLDAFQRIMITELKSGAKSSSNGLLGNIPSATEKQYVDLCKIHYVLAKIFSIEKHQKSLTDIGKAFKLKISWFPSKICRWLIAQGLFSPDQVEAALKSCESLSPDESLNAGDYTQAIVEWDKTCGILQLILKSPVLLEVNEIAHCLSHLLKLNKSGQKTDEMKLLTNNVSAIEKPEQDLQDTAAIDLLLPFQETDQRSPVYDLFSSILVRLTTHANSKISKALGAELSSLELRGLTDLLRLELAQGQWLSTHLERIQNDSTRDLPKNGQINNIATLLNCAIDCLGTGGWVLAASGAEDLAETAETVAYMKAEVSAALEGIEEATYLKGMLGEVLLFDKNSRDKNQHLLPIDQFVSQARSSMVKIAENRDALPIGLRNTQIAPDKKVGAGGEIKKRTGRDMGRLRSQIVGKYSFDRIKI